MNLVIGCSLGTTHDTLDGDRPGREPCFEEYTQGCMYLSFWNMERLWK